MKNILYFALLTVALSSFAEEQLEEKKVDSIHENVDPRKNSLPVDIDQKDELVDSLNAERTQIVEKTISEGLPNEQIKENTDESAKNLPDVINKEVVVSANLDGNTAQKNLPAIDVKNDEISKSELLEGKKEEIGSQSEEKKITKDRNRENRQKPIAEKDEEGKQEEKENLQKWTKLNREPIKEWDHKDIQSELIYKRQYDRLNEHLPTTVFIDDYSKQFFYCIKKNNLLCLRGIISKLEKIGLTTQEVLRFRNKLGDTPLIYAVKQGKIDIVRFLLLQGADPRVVNNDFQSPIDIAIKKKQVKMINVIAEMMPHLMEDRKIDNKESSEMYNWAMKTKENSELQCDEN